MVNKGRIYREIRKFMMISLNLIKLDDELMIEIGENGILRKRIQDESTKSKIIKFDVDFAEKLKIEVGDAFRKLELQK